MSKTWIINNSNHLMKVTGDYNVATILPAQLSMDTNGKWNDPTLANARLIAAAPELLDALINLLEDVEYAQPQIEPGLIGNRQIRKAHAAIDKAIKG